MKQVTKDDKSEKSKKIEDGSKEDEEDEANNQGTSKKLEFFTKAPLLPSGPPLQISSRCAKIFQTGYCGYGDTLL